MDQIGVPTQSELSHQEPEVVLTRNEVGCGGHVDHEINVGGPKPSVGKGATAGSEGQIAVEHPPFSPAPLTCSAEVIVQPPFIDTEMSHDPLGLKRSAVRADGMQVFEDFLVGDLAIR
jgi:hypothetical protein